MNIVGLTHLWPKSDGDKRGVYIRQMYDRLAIRNDVRVLIPTAPGLVARPPSPGTPTVLPFSYFLPRAWSTFGYGGGLTGDQRLSRTSLALAPLYALGAALRVRRQRRDATIVHAHFLVPNGAIAAAASGSVPLVISLHGSDIYLAEKNGVLRRAAQFAIRRAAHIVPCSDDLATRVIALGADPARVTVIPYGADPAIFSRPVDAAARARVREQAGAGARPMILFVGNLLPKKGITHLLDAAKRVLAVRPDAFFAIVGGGPLRDELLAQAASLSLAPDDVRFVGEVPWAEIPSWYAAADVFTAPSVIDPAGNVDGLPNVILEALATGLPVVASRVAGIAMVVKPGETGVLVPPGDAGALAAALLETLGDRERAKALGQGGRRLLESEMTWERIAERYEELFAKLLPAG